MEKLSDLELFQVLKQKNDYQDKAVEAAENEIRKRNLSEEDEHNIYAQIKAIEVEKARTQEQIETIKEKVSKIIKYIAVPVNFKSPSTIINSIGIYLIIQNIWEYQFFQSIYWLLKEGIYEGALFVFLSTAFGVLIAIGLFKKYKFGWILLTLTSIISFTQLLANSYISWFIYYEDPVDFATLDGFFYFLFGLIIPLAIVVYINKKIILNYFKISNRTQKITLSICFAISILGIGNSIYLSTYLYDKETVGQESEIQEYIDEL
ncbi:hypothetical protein JYU16_00510 [bacterium AH-315-M05]|nr:hypothetical protein [bacterium AH-315-M05]